MTYIPFMTSGSPFPSPSIGGDVRVIPGDFNGSGSTDALLYQPGTAADLLLHGRWYGFGAVPTKVSGSYRPVSGDFDGNGYDDILWYAPGTTPDALWERVEQRLTDRRRSPWAGASPRSPGTSTATATTTSSGMAPGTAADTLWNGRAPPASRAIRSR